MPMKILNYHGGLSIIKADETPNAACLMQLRLEGPAVNSPERQLGVGAANLCGTKGRHKAKMPPSVLIVCSILSQPGGRA
jgi:hypothetical protein